MSSSTRNAFSRTTWIRLLVLLIAGVVWYVKNHPNAFSLPSNSSPKSDITPDPNLIARGFVQNPTMTPGDVLTTDVKTVCTAGYTKTVRNVPSSLKHQVYQSYGITAHKPGDYEIDHLISLELGGSNSVRNLWPESFKSQPLNAHVKDEIENKLHEMICSGKIAIFVAQREIANDWTAAYQKYIGPLPR